MNVAVETLPETKPIVIDKKHPFDVVIIGGGPAGISAAIYCLRYRLNALMVEKMVLGGGASAACHIDNYPGFPFGISGLDFSRKMAEQSQRMGLKVAWENVIRINNAQEIQLDDKIIYSKSIIIATGTEAKKLGVAGEKDFLGKGVSYCATCDGPFYQDKNVIVVGGGNTAVEEALFLTRYANKVSIVHRRDSLRADKILAEMAQKHPKIYFYWHSTVEKISGDKTVNEITLKDILSNNILRIPADGIFVYVGSKSNSEIAKDLLKTDDTGSIITDEEMRTSAAGIFAAGDVRKKTLRQIVTAVSDGAVAANSARQYLEKLDK